MVFSSANSTVFDDAFWSDFSFHLKPAPILRCTLEDPSNKGSGNISAAMKTTGKTFSIFLSVYQFVYQPFLFSSVFLFLICIIVWLSQGRFEADGPQQYHIHYTSFILACIKFNIFIIKIIIVFLLIFIYGNLILSLVADRCRASWVLITWELSYCLASFLLIQSLLLAT